MPPHRRNIFLIVAVCVCSSTAQAAIIPISVFRTDWDPSAVDGNPFPFAHVVTVADPLVSGTFDIVVTASLTSGTDTLNISRHQNRLIIDRASVGGNGDYRNLNPIEVLSFTIQNINLTPTNPTDVVSLAQTGIAVWGVNSGETLNLTKGVDVQAMIGTSAPNINEVYAVDLLLSPIADGDTYSLNNPDGRYRFNGLDFEVDVTPVPEPTVSALFAGGLLLMIMAGRKGAGRRRKDAERFQP